MALRLAQSEDASAVAQLYAVLTAEMATLAPSVIQPLQVDRTAYFRDYIEDDNSAIFVVEEAHRLVGFALVVVANTGEQDEIVFHRFAYCIDLFVLAQFRHRGFGQALLEAVNTWALTRDLAFVQLNVLAANEDARAFYQQAGFNASQLTLTRTLKED